MDYKQSIKLNAKVMWAFHNKVNNLSEKYQIDLCELSDAAVEALQNDLGVEARNKGDEKGNFITCRSVMPLKIVDLEGKSLQDVAIGNGSSGVAIVSSYDWKSKMGKGTSPTLQKMVINDLQVYEGGVADDGDGDVL